MLHVRLLGAVTASAGASEVTLGGPRRRAVLTLLAMAVPRPVSSDQLIDDLWAESPPQSARNAIQVNVTGLRKAFTPHGVSVERIGDGYALRGPVTVDVAQFEEGVASGRAAPRSGDAPHAQSMLENALELWQGQPFGGIGAPPFVSAQLQPLEDLRKAALVELAAAQLMLGDPVNARHTAQSLLGDHPFDERGWVALAVSFYWSGQQDEALAACRRARAVLADELGIDPTPALLEIERQILHHELSDPTASAASAAASAEQGARPQPPPIPALPRHVVGRDSAAEEIEALLKGGERLLTLVGIGGIGKTTLALAAAHRIESVWFCSLETEETAGQALARICRAVGVDVVDEDGIDAFAPPLAGAVLVLDNLEQVAGIGRLLDDLLSRVPGLVIVGTSRRPTGARRERLVKVPPLSAESAEELFSELAERVRPGVTDVDAAAVPLLCGLLDGIPLALELAAGRVRTLTPRQLVARIEDRRISVLDPSPATSGPDRQASLDNVLRDAYQALSGPAAALFELLGSVEGSVTLDLLEAAAAGLVSDPVAALDELVGCGLVSLDLQGRASMRGPVREFARRMGPRADLDARLVGEVVRLVARSAPLLFGPTTGDALERLRLDEQPIDATLTQAVHAGDHASATSLALGLNRYWLLTGRLTEGRAFITRAASMPGHDKQDAVRLAVLAGTYASYFDDPRTPVMLSGALTDAKAVGLPLDRLIVNGWCCLAAFAAHHNDAQIADQATSRAGELAAVSGDGTLIGLARDIEGHVASYFRDYERALGAKLSGLTEVRAAGDTYDEICLLTDIAEDLMNLGRTNEALVFSDEAFDLTAHFDVGPTLGTVLLLRGFVLVAAGRVPAARGNLLQALRIIQDRRPDPLALADCLFALGNCAAQDLDVTNACRLYGAASRLYADQGISEEDRLAQPMRSIRDTMREGLDPETYATLSTLGNSDPTRVVEIFLRGTHDEGPGGDRDTVAPRASQVALT
jgi:DNA-binding SARP family transcriptional activator/predicted ATPase